ncbi:thioesterase II family protein [Kitasatospora sp. NPDC096147]|uniref:thioesterase II family protein n=1 Tax=Kitasatospora sp. NPDC096147 TaxID=3364093 RepID=UPI0038287AE1
MAETTARKAKWLLREPSDSSAVRLFCIPYSGCGASMYRKWPRYLGEVEICAVQLPGRENRLREPAYGTYEELADDFAEALLPYLDRPFAFFGHCGSALPGYETSVRLLERGYPLPSRLFVSSQVAPHQGPAGRFLEMSDEELSVEVAELITSLGGKPTTDMVELSIRILRADVEANKRYKPEKPTVLPLPISALGWAQDVEVDYRLMDGWADCGETSFRLLQGPHYQFMEAPDDLMAAISEDLADFV